MSIALWDVPLLIFAGKRFSESWAIQDRNGESIIPDVTSAEFRLSRNGIPDDAIVWSMASGEMDIVNGELVLEVEDTDDIEPGDWTALLSIGLEADEAPERPQATGRVTVKREP